MGHQLIRIGEHLGCHSTYHGLWIAVEIVIISVISPILVAALAATATASSTLVIIIVVATLRLIGSSFSSRVLVVIISIIMMIVVGAAVATPVIAARTAASATLRTRASLVTILTSTVCISLLVCALGLVLTSSTLAMVPLATRVVILRRICSSVSACSRLNSSLRGTVAAACSSMDLLEVNGLVHGLARLLLLLTRVVHNLLPIDGGWLTILSRLSRGRRRGTRRCRWCARLGRWLARLIHRLALVCFLVWF